jgi:TolB-like protein
MDPVENPTGDTPAAGDTAKLGKKKKDKVRNAWISFGGRIVAQVVGAGASVALGLMVLQRSQQGTPPAAEFTTPQRAATPQPPPARGPGETALAVLPLDNFSRQADQEYFADGMTEALIANLAQVEGLRVISRTSTMRYKTNRPSLPEVARALNVDLVVEGSVTRAGDRVRITAQLIDAQTDEHVWAEAYDRTLRDVLTLQREVATAIAQAIKGSVTRRNASEAAARRTVDPAVYDLYLRGRHAVNQRTSDGFSRAVDLLSEAVAKDPEFALTHVALSEAYSLQGSPAEGPAEGRARVQRAKTHAERAIALDPDLAEGHTALGGVLFFGERQYAAAEDAFRRAIQLNPAYPIAYEWLAILLAERGRAEEAASLVDRAVTLDPLDGTLHQGRGMILYNAGRFADAVTAERRALLLTPQLPLARDLLIKALVMQGDLAGATTLCGDPGPEPRHLLVCAIAFQRAGRASEAQALRDRIARAPATDVILAQLDAATGNLSAAFRTLGRLATTGNLPPGLAFDPMYEDLRRDRRWAEITRRVAF